MTDPIVIEVYDDNIKEVADILKLTPEELCQLVLICRIKRIDYLDHRTYEGNYRIDLSKGFPRKRETKKVNPNQTMLPITFTDFA